MLWPCTLFLYPLLPRSWLADQPSFAQWRLCRCSWRGLFGSTSVGYCSRVRVVKSQHSEEVAQREERAEQANRVSSFSLSLDSMRLRLHPFISAKPSEPPLPYPPPSPFVPLRAGDIDDQIGLLKPYYNNRITLLVAASAPPIPVAPAPLPGPALGPSLVSLDPSVPPPPPPTIPPGNQLASPPNPPAPVPSDLILPDDAPNPIQLKMGPVGQIVKSSGTGGGTKKKGKAVVEGGVAGGSVITGSGPSVLPVAVGMSGTRLADPGAQKKKKSGATGVGTGNGRKKNAPPLAPPPPPPSVVMR